MTDSKTHNLNRLYDLIDSHREGCSLAGELYSDEDVYEFEIARIWQRGWLFVAHDCEIPEPGDYVTVEVGDDSLIVVRDDSGSICAMHNTCRHRGTLICHQPKGHVGLLVCPYHQWTYTRSGTLHSCRGMQQDIDKSRLGLHPGHVRLMDGMVFVCLADNPTDFQSAYDLMAPIARPQGLQRARIAKVIEYKIEANWKLVWENNRECYHCDVNHPEYIRANFDRFNSDDTSERIQQQLDEAIRRLELNWGGAGTAVNHKRTGVATFPDPDNDVWYSANRTPLVEGYVSESLDGSQVAPLMGDYRDPEVGTLRLRTMPNMWLHASCDHAVSTRLLPAGPNCTRARVTWLVEQNAVEGQDYQLEKLLPFWQMTSEQDWELCEWAQKGVSSSRYIPGPLSTTKEYNVDAFVRWYLKELATA